MMRIQVVVWDGPCSKVFTNKKEYKSFVGRLIATKKAYYTRNINNKIGMANKDREW